MKINKLLVFSDNNSVFEENKYELEKLFDEISFCDGKNENELENFLNSHADPKFELKTVFVYIDKFDNSLTPFGVSENLVKLYDISTGFAKFFFVGENGKKSFDSFDSEFNTEESVNVKNNDLLKYSVCKNSFNDVLNIFKEECEIFESNLPKKIDLKKFLNISVNFEHDQIGGKKNVLINGTSINLYPEVPIKFFKMWFKGFSDINIFLEEKQNEEIFKDWVVKGVKGISGLKFDEEKNIQTNLRYINLYSIYLLIFWVYFDISKNKPSKEKKWNDIFLNIDSSSDKNFIYIDNIEKRLKLFEMLEEFFRAFFNTTRFDEDKRYLTVNKVYFEVKSLVIELCYKFDSSKNGKHTKRYVELSELIKTYNSTATLFEIKENKIIFYTN